MNCGQKDIVLIPFPYSDLTGSKLRPALIVSNNLLNKTKDSRICCLVTSNSPKDGIPIDRTSFEKDTLPFKSWIKPQRLFTIEETIIRKKLCVINDNLFDNVVLEINRFIKRKE